MKFTYSSGSKPLEGYTVKRGVGIGGFGEVYYAVSDAGKEVALKLVRRNLDVELRGVRHCINLKHHNLIRLYDIRQDDQEDSWIVMEYVNGESLEDVIARHPNGMPEEMVHRWFHQLTSGVAYLHNHGIVHRDLKPGNIFQDNDEVKIGDYGLSKFISCSRRSGQTESVGTVHYMAPEIGNGRYGKEIDIYALGIILFEMLTGRLPFEGESVGEVLMKHLTSEPDVSDLNSPYREIIQKALIKDPEVRTSSVAEMVGSLPVLSGYATVAPPSQNSSNTNCAETVEFTEAEAMANAQVIDDKPVEIVEPNDTSNAQSATNNEEPIWQAAKRGFNNLGDWWNSESLNTTTKIILMVAGIILLIQFSAFLVPVGMVLGVGYILYWVVREAYLYSASQDNQPPRATSANAPPIKNPPNNHAAAAEATTQVSATIQAELADLPHVVPPQHHFTHGQHFQTHREKRRSARRNLAMRRLGIKPMRQKVTELFGSMLFSALVVGILSFLSILLISSASGLRVSRDQDFLVQFAWFSSICVASCWSLLIASKFWEGQEGERGLRFFVLLTIGLGIGLLAWLLTDFFYAQVTFMDRNLRDEWDMAMFFKNDPEFIKLVGRNGSYAAPTLVAYMLYFAAMIGIQRWWKQTDPLRSSRFRIWKTAATIFFALLCSVFIPFPQPIGAFIAIVVSVALQLSSPWVNLKENDPAQAESLV